MSTAHVFYYRWSRIKEGLVHEAVEFSSVWGLHQAVQGVIPVGGFLLYNGSWYRKSFQANAPSGRARISTQKILVPTNTDHVPKEIRAMALLFT